MAVQSIAAADDVRLTLCQPLRHQPPHKDAVIPVLQVIQHGVAFAHHIADGQVAAVAVCFEGIAEGYLALQLFPRTKVHQDFIFNTPAGVCCQTDALVGLEGVHGLDEADRADGDQILLLFGLRVVFFEDAVSKANLSRV